MALRVQGGSGVMPSWSSPISLLFEVVEKGGRQMVSGQGRWRRTETLLEVCPAAVTFLQWTLHLGTTPLLWLCTSPLWLGRCPLLTVQHASWSTIHMPAGAPSTPTHAHLEALEFVSVCNRGWHLFPLMESLLTCWRREFLERISWRQENRCSGAWVPFWSLSRPLARLPQSSE